MGISKLAALSRAGVLATTAVLSVSISAQAEEAPPIVTRAEQCLRHNVDRVVAVEPNLESAADFLVNYACASEVAGAARYRRNIGYLSAITSMSKTMTSSNFGPQAPANPALSTEIKATVDPETGEFILPKRAPGQPQNMFEAMLPQLSMSNAQILPDVAPTDLRKLAGELVLSAREQRNRQR